jgi:asparagine synthase (glutamine-hydrolysing)
MCGLFGRLSYADAAVHAPGEAIERGLLALAARRGPDDEGFCTPGPGCVMGLRRLSILDLSPAAGQPMRIADGRHCLVYNGELYNHAALRAELERAGVRFRSRGDTEVVLHALVTWGREALARFNGMFALAFYDARAGRVLLARDHAGMKPLYYLLSPAGVVFASQYDQILDHPWSADAACAPDALGLYLRLGYIPAPYAFLRGSHLLPPGAWLEVDSQRGVREGRFFEFPVERTPDLAGSEADDAVFVAVQAAVRRHLVADVPVGTFLSGGVDSPLIAATMRAMDPGPLRAFTLGTGGDEFDESADAAGYARAFGALHAVAHLTPDRVLPLVADVVSACAEPFADYSIFPTLCVSELARRDVKVVLSGDGGDELFFGYAGRSGTLLQLLTAARERGDGASGGDWLRILEAGRGTNDSRWPSTIGDLQRITHTRDADRWLRRVFPDLPPWPEECRLFAFDSRDPDRTADWLRWNEFVGYLPSVLQKVDRGSMFHSLEVRAPLLDREVIEVATRVHWRACLDPQRRIGKLPLRHLLARHCRQQTLAKRGFTVPMGAWLRGPLRALLQETLMRRSAIASLAVDRSALRELIGRHLAAAADLGWQLWLLLSLALWEDRYLSRRGAPYVER